MCRGEALSSCFADNKLEMSRFKAAEVMIDFFCVHLSLEVTDSMYVNFYGSVIESLYPSLKIGVQSLLLLMFQGHAASC